MNEYSEPRPQIQHEIQPSNYLVWAILTTVFCCMPFGIVSIVFAAQVNSKWQSGDYTGARIASRNARLWALISFGTAIILGFITVMLSVFVGLSSL